MGVDYHHIRPNVTEKSPIDSHVIKNVSMFIVDESARVSDQTSAIAWTHINCQPCQLAGALMHVCSPFNYVFITCSLCIKLTFKTDMTTFTGGTSSSVTAGLAVLDKTALFKTKPLEKQARTKNGLQFRFPKMFKNVFKRNFNFKIYFSSTHLSFSFGSNWETVLKRAVMR